MMLYRLLRALLWGQVVLQNSNDFPITIDQDGSYIEFSSQWEVLGPFQIGTRGSPQRKAIWMVED